MEEKKTGAAAALALLNQKFPVADVIAGTKCERAIKWELTIGDDLKPKWTHSIVCVSIEKTPFAKGSCRTAHKLKDWSQPDQGLVGKFSTNKKTTRDSYFTDVLMQTFCAKWAEKFNEAKPPKPITFLPSYVYELIDHPPPYPVCGGEPFIEGDYKKHNNNSGYVSSDARNTPQSFSHFSYELSNHELLIVDIQGVNDFYTDPQIHTKSLELDEDMIMDGKEEKEDLVLNNFFNCCFSKGYIDLTELLFEHFPKKLSISISNLKHAIDNSCYNILNYYYHHQNNDRLALELKSFLKNVLIK